MEDLKKIQEFFSKGESVNENTFKVGQKVTYLGHPAVVTATKEYNGRNFVSVSYDKGTGKTKASDILTTSGDIKLVPIGGAGAKKLTDKYGFFSQSAIPSGTYENVGTTNTVAVGAQWFTSAKEDEELIYNITKALWNDESRKLMDVGHAKGKTITPETALSGVGVPLHPGAERFYKEAGLIK